MVQLSCVFVVNLHAYAVPLKNELLIREPLSVEEREGGQIEARPKERERYLHGEQVAQIHT